MKRIVCMLMSVVLIISCLFVPVSAETVSEAIELKQDSKELALLKTLGIVEPNMAPDKIITRTELAQILAVFTGYVDSGYEARFSLKYKPATGKMTQYDYQRIEGKPIFKDVPETYWAVGFIEDVALKGFMKGSAEDKYIFNPDENASYDDVYDIMLKLLGYTPLLEVVGGDYRMNVLQYARRANIWVGSGNEMTADNLARIIYSTLHADVMEMSSISSVSGATYTQKRKYMEYAFDMYVADDVIVEATNVAELYTGTNVISDTMIADGVKYSDKDNMAFDYLGDNCDIYYEVNKDTDIKSVKAIIVNSEIEAETVRDNIISLEQGSLKYYGKKDRMQTLNLSVNLDVVYNNQCWYGWTYADLLIPEAKYVFIDTDRDGASDLLKIYDYKYIIVDSVTERTKTVRSSFNFPASSIGLKQLCLDGDTLNKELFVTITQNGAKTDFSKITKGMMLAVLMGKGNSGSDEISITVELLDLGKTIKIDGLSNQPGIEIGGQNLPDVVYTGDVEYEVSKDYYSAFSAFKTGEIGKAYITKNDKIIAFSKISAAGNQYGYIKQVGKSDGAFDKTLMIKMFTADGTWVIFDTKEKLKVNGTSGKTGQRLAAAGIITLSGNDVASVTPQLVRYTYEENIIKSIETVQVDLTAYTDPVDIYEQTRAAISQDAFRLSNYRTDFKHTGSLKSLSWIINLRTACPTFLIPQNAETADEDSFAVRSSDKSFSYNVETTVWSYDEDLFGSPKVMVIDAGDGATGASPANTLFLVDSLCYALDDNGEICMKADGYYEGEKTGIFIKDSMVSRLGEATIKKDFAEGNILKLALSVDNKIENYSFIYSPEVIGDTSREGKEGKYLKVSSCIGSAPTQYAIVQGVDRTANTYRLYGDTVNDGANPYRNIWFNRGANHWVAIYDGDSRDGCRIRLADMSEIEEGDYLVTRYQDSTPYASVVYRNIFN